MAGPERFEWAGAPNVPDESCPAACSTMRDLGAVVFAGPATTATAGEVGRIIALREGEQATEAAGPCMSMLLRPTFSCGHPQIAMMSLVTPRRPTCRCRTSQCRVVTK